MVQQVHKGRRAIKDLKVYKVLQAQMVHKDQPGQQVFKGHKA